MAELGLRTHPDGLRRCWWCGEDPLYLNYHDTEWGRPLRGDVAVFERICLEGFQAGLSWLTILRKRDNFRRAFRGFDLEAVAAFGPADVARLLADRGIVRHRGKIEATIGNARCALRLGEEFGSLGAWVEASFPAEPRPGRITRAYLDGLKATPVSTRVSRDLVRRGWRFVGPTTVYSFMQATGIVNDHISGCAFRNRGRH